MTNAEIERRILDQAYDSAERTAAAAGGAEEALGDVIAEARDLREKIASGAVSPDDARRALAALRQRHREIAAHVPSIKIVYEGAVKTIEDPVAKVTELTSKFGSLQSELIMPGRRVSHSESRWAQLPATVIRCNATRPNGSRCKREAEDGAVVCDQHGGAGPQVRRRAAERLIMTADQAAQMLVRMMEDTEVPFGVRAKIAQDLLDRAGLVAAQVHKIVPTTEDPIMRFFEGAFGDPSNWESTTSQPDPTPAIESYATSSGSRHGAEPEEIVEAEIVEPEGEPANDTPPRIAEMIKAGAFDRKAGE